MIPHDQSEETGKDCWCCPTIERVWSIDNEYYIDIVVHNEKEDAN